MFCLANIPDGTSVVIQIIGGEFKVISDPDTSSEISRLTINNDAVGSVYTQEGHTFYVLTFPNDGITKVYDVTQQMWHNRASFPLNRWRVGGMGYLDGIVYAVDFTDGNIYTVNRDAYNDNGVRIEKKRRTQVIHQNRKEFICWRYELEFNSGQITGDPDVLFRYSWDGGNTFSDWRQVRLGDIGEFTARVIFYELGDGVELITEYLVSDDTPLTLIGGYADIEVKAF